MNRMSGTLRKTIKYILIGWLAGIPLVQAEKSSADKAIDPGEILFKTYCTACHGLKAKGDGPAAPALKKKPADLTKIAKRRKGKFDFVEMASIIDGRAKMDSHGSRKMPIWGKRFGENIKADALKEELISGNLLMLVLYLQSIQK